jgi:hypothetical protein
MGLKNCPECGKLYIENPSGLCVECHQQQEENEFKVAEYLRKVSRSTIAEIHEATGVKEKIILQMIKQKRIFGDVEVAYPCESCGLAIIEGRLCAKCTKNITDQVKSVDWQTADARKDHGKVGRMYTKDMNRHES